MIDSAQGTALSTVVAIATVVTPILLVLLGGIGWFFQHRIQRSQTREEGQAARIRELEDRLRDDRLATYDAILEPFFLLFTSDAAFAQDPKFKNKDKNTLAVSKLLSVEYRKSAFKLSLVANDSVVRAFNRLMQFFYRLEADPQSVEDKTRAWLALMGDLLLEIRKGMGNEASTLDRWEMIEWFMKEASEVRVLHARLEVSKVGTTARA